MKQALTLANSIEQVRAKLEESNIDINDYDAAIKCLSSCVLPKHCIDIYCQYINY